ncbi:hypothetical protein [Halomonas sp. JS92-SW72]|uniref:hypothetical protein n=1 Tax=Halomonas sp. JS92-SW72 TaxID=2306583 RepID=UPI0019693A97|nr:hypothetical protein [Halomonas sp. JS92-SW72]
MKEYLASLKERGDLDKSVLPNLLSEIGLRVLNTPMIGTRQNGVDIAAVGQVKGEDEQRYLYLFCIKAGNVTRRDWEVSEQSVRPELNEIKDVYLRSNVAQEHAELPIKICLCCGGELEETVLMNWAGYTEQNKTDKISYELWNGDRLADLMMRCLLARELLDEEPRRNFQKAVAMVNEPNACYEYTRAFLGNLLLEEQTSQKNELLRLRQSYICLHAVIAWAIEANNLESTYKVSELGMLFCWNAIRKRLPKKKPTKHDNALMFVLDQFLKLYLTTSEMYLSKTAYAHGGRLHALSVAVRSRESVDVNLAMFELLGRLAIRGIWTDHFSKSLSGANPGLLKSLAESTDRTLDTMVLLISNNPTLSSPIRDDHMIEIALVMYLAQLTQKEIRFLPWLRAISDKTTFALVTNTKYPTCLHDYADLLSHPVSAEQSYRDEACAGSVLYPYIFFWMQYVADVKEIAEFTERLERQIPNCTHQAWFPDEDSDDLIWHGETYHGICVTDVSPHNGHEALAGTLNKAMETCTAITDVSAVRKGLIPMFLTACRHYRLPVPPSFWFVRTQE